MSFNHKKCNAHHAYFKPPFARSPLWLHHEGSKLEIVDSYPCLGHTISFNLKWNDHVNNVIKKASRSLGMLRRNISMCSKDRKNMAYNTLVRSHLEYASSVWDSYTDELVEAIEKVQRCAARFVKSDYRRTSTFHRAIHNQIAVPSNHLTKPNRQTQHLHAPDTQYLQLQIKPLPINTHFIHVLSEIGTIYYHL